MEEKNQGHVPIKTSARDVIASRPTPTALHNSRRRGEGRQVSTVFPSSSSSLEEEPSFCLALVAGVNGEDTRDINHETAWTVMRAGVAVGAARETPTAGEAVMLYPCLPTGVPVVPKWVDDCEVRDGVASPGVGEGGS